MGVSTQRGTGTFWEAKSGKVLNNFVTWQDIRCKEFVDEINGALATKIIRDSRFISDQNDFTVKSPIFIHKLWAFFNKNQGQCLNLHKDTHQVFCISLPG